MLRNGLQLATIMDSCDAAMSCYLKEATIAYPLLPMSLLHLIQNINNDVVSTGVVPINGKVKWANGGCQQSCSPHMHAQY